MYELTLEWTKEEYIAVRFTLYLIIVINTFWDEVEFL